MALIDDLKDRLRVEEGVRLKPYRDSVGIETIGVGRNLQAKGLRMDEVDLMLTNDVNEVLDQLANLTYWSTLPTNVQTVLADMAFNLGFDGLSKFHLMLNAVELGNYEEAAEQMLQSKWATQVGQRAQNLAQLMKGQ